MGREELNRFFKIVKRIIERFFGVVTKEKKAKHGVRRIYSLNNKKVVATLHLFGKDDSDFNPHINVLIFEDDSTGGSLRISLKKLQEIKEAYRIALRYFLGVDIERIVIHYKYHQGLRAIEQCIWYMTIPLNLKTFWNLYRKRDLGIIYLIMYELSGFRHLRFWGRLANSEYKKHLAGN
jgi:hypothetical protein